MKYKYTFTNKFKAKTIVKRFEPLFHDINNQQVEIQYVDEYECQGDNIALYVCKDQYGRELRLFESELKEI